VGRGGGGGRERAREVVNENSASGCAVFYQVYEQADGKKSARKVWQWTDPSSVQPVLSGTVKAFLEVRAPCSIVCVCACI
jgi:hypothetical protein